MRLLGFLKKRRRRLYWTRSWDPRSTKRPRWRPHVFTLNSEPVRSMNEEIDKRAAELRADLDRIIRP